MAANWKKRRLRYVAVFGQLFRQRQRLPVYPKMGVPEIKSNRSRPLLCRDAVWRTWSIAAVLDRLRRRQS
jgi:hypothetical protein